MGAYIAIALVIVLVIIYLLLSSKPKTAEDFLEKSNGTFDSNAKKALTVIEEKETKTAQDYVNRAEIKRHNILYDNLHAAKDRKGVVVDIATDYANGLDMLSEDDPAIMFVAERMRGMRDNYVAAFEYTPEDIEIAHILDNTFQAADKVDTRAAQVRFGRARHQAAAEGKTRSAAVTNYLKETAVVTDDKQNVHDSQVNHDLRETLKIISAESTSGLGPKAAIEAAKRYIADNATGTAAKNAQKTLETVALGATISALGLKENEVFAAIWNRAEHPTNMLNESEIKDAIVAALSECVEGEGLVCANGRCGRVINSLASIDANPLVGSIGSFEMYKNNLIKESEEIMEKVLNKKRKEYPELVKKWENGEDVPQITSALKKAINANIDKYSDKILPRGLSTIRNLCITAVE